MITHRLLAGVVALAGVACSQRSATPEPEPATASTTAPGGAATPRPPSFAGSFRGDIEGTPATLTAQQQGDRLTGTIDAGGYGYVVDGKVSGSGAGGTLTDPQTGGALTFEATLSGDEVRFVVATGNAPPMTLAFRRSGAVAAAPGATPAAPAVPTPVPTPAAGAGGRDPRIVGTWSYREQLGDPRTGSMLIKWHLIVRPDGTFTYGNDTSQHDGQWRTDGATIHVNDGSGWEPYARFTIDGGGRMMFTLASGTRQIWRRR